MIGKNSRHVLQYFKEKKSKSQLNFYSCFQNTAYLIPLSLSELWSIEQDDIYVCSILFQLLLLPSQFFLSFSFLPCQSCQCKSPPIFFLPNQSKCFLKTVFDLSLEIWFPKCISHCRNSINAWVKRASQQQLKQISKTWTIIKASHINNFCKHWM